MLICAAPGGQGVCLVRWMRSIPFKPKNRERSERFFGARHPPAGRCCKSLRCNGLRVRRSTSPEPPPLHRSRLACGGHGKRWRGGGWCIVSRLCDPPGGSRTHAAIRPCQSGLWPIQPWPRLDGERRRACAVRRCRGGLRPAVYDPATLRRVAGVPGRGH